jgi:Ni,Fe-hydrogenase III small subunit
MIVAGTLTNKMAPALRKVYDQMPGECSVVWVCVWSRREGATRVQRRWRAWQWSGLGWPVVLRVAGGAA